MPSEAKRLLVVAGVLAAVAAVLLVVAVSLFGETSRVVSLDMTCDVGDGSCSTDALLRSTSECAQGDVDRVEIEVTMRDDDGAVVERDTIVTECRTTDGDGAAAGSTPAR